MPSLQQLNFKDGTHPDIDKTLTGSDILHRHSINSLLEQQELISRGLSSPSAEGETLTISDMLNLSNNTRTTSSLIGNQTTNSLSAALSNIPSSQSSLSPGIFMPQAKNYDAFQFDNIGLNSPLKMFQRNLSFDCSPSTPMSPSTPSPLYQSRPIRGSPYNRECNSPAAQDTNQIPALYGLSSRSNSPDSDNSAISNIDTNLIELMNYLALNQSQVRQLSSQPQCGGDISGNQVLNGISQADLELAKLQNLQTLSALKLLQQPPSPLQMPMLNLNQLLQQCNTNQLKNWQQLQQQQQTNHQVQLQSSVTNTNDANLDRVARFHRSSAAMREATCTWSGVLPPRSHKIINYSSKVFLGGIPWDITEQSLLQIFKPFGQIKVEWPGKEQKASKPKGHVYIIFESEKQVRALLASCSIRDGDALNGGKYYCRISSRRIKTKEVEVKPWIIGDSNYVKSTSQKLDPTKTIFVGALHGKLTAEGLAVIMNDLFDGVVYAGIDTDKYKYPIGSGRVTFNNSRSYMKAVSAAFIEIKTSLFTKTVQVDPYLEDSLCSVCGVQQGPYYCREMSCFRYFCRSCWQWQHNNETMFRNHKPLSRNSKSQALVGIGPQANIQSENNTIQKLKTRMEYY